MKVLRWIAGVALALALVEAFLRASIGELTPRVFDDRGSSEALSLAPDVRSDSRMFGRDVHVSTDRSGLRSTVGAAVDLDARTLHIVGDSQVFGWGLNDAETVASRMQAVLGPRWVVKNHGVPGYGPWQYQKVLSGLPVDEPVLLLFTEENDLWDSFELATFRSYCGYMSTGSAARWHVPCALVGSRLFQVASSWYGYSSAMPTPLGFAQVSTVAATVASGRVMEWLSPERARRRDRLLVSIVPWRGRFSRVTRDEYFPSADRAQDASWWPDDCSTVQLFSRADEAGSLYLAGDSHLSPSGALLLSSVLLQCLRNGKLLSGARDD
jgi:hypothetical protein